MRNRFAEDLVVLFDNDAKKNPQTTLRKITEQRIAFKFCVAEITFSNYTIKTLREAEIILKLLQKCIISLFIKKTFEFLVSEF